MTSPPFAIADLSIRPPDTDPLAQIVAGAIESAARQGLDIANMDCTAWTTCIACDCPATSHAGKSSCHGAPLRMQGWALWLA